MSSDSAMGLKLHEVAPKVTLLRMPANLLNYIIHKPVYDKISAADREAIRRVSIEADKRSAEYMAKSEIEADAAIKTLKTDVYSLTPQEVKALRSGLAPGIRQNGRRGRRGRQADRGYCQEILVTAVLAPACGERSRS